MYYAGHIWVISTILILVPFSKSTKRDVAPKENKPKQS